MKNIKNYIDYNKFWKENYEESSELTSLKITMDSLHIKSKLLGYDLLSENKDEQAGFYLCAGLEEISQDRNPYEDMTLIQTYQGQLFFPHNFAINLEDNDSMTVYEAVNEYVKNAYSVRELFQNILHKPIPEVMEYQDVLQISKDIKYLSDSDISVQDKKKVKNNLQEIAKKYDTPVAMKKTKIEDLMSKGSAVSYTMVPEHWLARLESKLKKEKCLMYYVDSELRNSGTKFDNGKHSQSYNPWEKYSDQENYYRVYYKEGQESVFTKVYNDVMNEMLNNDEILRNNEQVKNYILTSHDYTVRQLPYNLSSDFVKLAEKNNFVFAFINSSRLNNKKEHYNIIYQNIDNSKFYAIINELTNKSRVGYEVSRFSDNYNRVEPNKNNSKFKFWQR